MNLFRTSYSIRSVKQQFMQLSSNKIWKAWCCSEGPTNKRHIKWNKLLQMIEKIINMANNTFCTCNLTMTSIWRMPTEFIMWIMKRKWKVFQVREPIGDTFAEVFTIAQCNTLSIYIKWFDLIKKSLTCYVMRKIFLLIHFFKIKWT